MIDLIFEDNKILEVCMDHRNFSTAAMRNKALAVIGDTTDGLVYFADAQNNTAGGLVHPNFWSLLRSGKLRRDHVSTFDVASPSQPLQKAAAGSGGGMSILQYAIDRRLIGSRRFDEALEPLASEDKVSALPVKRGEGEGAFGRKRALPDSNPARGLPSACVCAHRSSCPLTFSSIQGPGTRPPPPGGMLNTFQRSPRTLLATPAPLLCRRPPRLPRGPRRDPAAGCH